METKFLNLKKGYKEFIKNTATRIRELNIETELTKEKCQQIFNLYRKISNEIDKSDEININDINHIMLDYGRDDPDIQLLKQFIKIKNMYIIKKIIASSQWEPFLIKLGSQLGDGKINKKQLFVLAKGVYRLLKSSIDKFKGCWEIAEFNDNKLKKIEIIEPEHFDFLNKYIKNDFN